MFGRGEEGRDLRQGYAAMKLPTPICDTAGPRRFTIKRSACFSERKIRRAPALGGALHDPMDRVQSWRWRSEQQILRERLAGHHAGQAIAIDRVDASHDHQIAQYAQQNQQIDAYIKAIRSASRSPETALKAS